MSEIRYFCEGGCKTMVTAAEFKQGNSVCKEGSCENNGRELKRGEYCSACNTNFDEGDDHVCF